VSSFCHIFRPGKVDPTKCAYRITIRDPDREPDQTIEVPCNQGRYVFPHITPVESGKAWEKIYDPNDKTEVRF
jgi:hypothetical protein